MPFTRLIVLFLASFLSFSSANVPQKFTKLVNLTEDPDDCVFVVCSSISRTEKFVRAMPNHPAYLNAGWIKASAEAGELQGVIRPSFTKAWE
jgi:hypothetical protein